MGTRRSQHNRGRKPVYKEHRLNMMAEVHSPSNEPLTATQILASPRYFNGLFLDHNTTWSDADLQRLRILAEAGSPLEQTAAALGRPPKSIAHRAQENRLILPNEWSKIIRPPYHGAGRGRPIAEQILCYPYVKKATIEAADLLRANDLVSKRMPDHMRADIVQEIMLALHEGRVDLETLEKHRENVRWFITKFYRQQMPHQEVSLEGAFDDNRSYEDIAASLKADWQTDQQNEARRALSGMAVFTAPTQVDDIYEQDVSVFHKRMYAKGEHVSREEAKELFESDISSQHERLSRLGQSSFAHVLQRAKERYGIDVLSTDLIPLRDACQRGVPRRVKTGSDNVEIHFIRFAGQRVACVYCRSTNVVLTVLPRDAVNSDGYRVDAPEEWYGKPEYRQGRVER